MKKIGILTFHKTLNYGAILQAYALEKVIESKNSNVEIINYKCEAVEKREFPTSINDVHGLKNIFKYFLGKSKREKKEKSFEVFMNKSLRISNKSYDSTNIKDMYNDYDLYITGSDQIWNLKLTGGDTTYFLSNVEDCSKKCSYAASFGYDSVPAEYLEITKEMFKNDFKALSVREQQGKEIINNLVNKDSNVVLDPTLLLSKEDWFSLLDIKKTNDKPYILVYLPHNKDKVFKFAKKIAKEKNYEIKYVNITYIPMPGVSNYYDLSPQKFLELLANASLVVTGSFHGVAFSINFNKEFFYEDIGGSSKFGSRISNLVGKVSLMDRIIDDNNNLSDLIDFSNVNKIINEDRKKSIEFIDNSIF